MQHRSECPDNLRVARADPASYGRKGAGSRATLGRGIALEGGVGMFRFALRVLGLWMLAGGFAAAVIDGMKSIAASKLVMGSALATWNDLSPASVAAVHARLDAAVGPELLAWLDFGLARIPTWAALGLLGALLVTLGLPREQTAPPNG